MSCDRVDTFYHAYIKRMLHCYKLFIRPYNYIYDTECFLKSIFIRRYLKIHLIQKSAKTAQLISHKIVFKDSKSAYIFWNTEQSQVILALLKLHEFNNFQTVRIPKFYINIQTRRENSVTALISTHISLCSDLCIYG